MHTSDNSSLHIHFKIKVQCDVQQAIIHHNRIRQCRDTYSMHVKYHNNAENTSQYMCVFITYVESYGLSKQNNLWHDQQDRHSMCGLSLSYILADGIMGCPRKAVEIVYICHTVSFGDTACHDHIIQIYRQE